ncbi:hypothetical protein CP533_4597 [Ophiocordyceps camponoti-saundersi (nom. inval.)]|nr:hypothetical protein CP533_4597 [Ophiocordyceps camponoti-saundersi (nom. inval.)]
MSAKGQGDNRQGISVVGPFMYFGIAIDGDVGGQSEEWGTRRESARKHHDGKYCITYGLLATPEHGGRGGLEGDRDIGEAWNAVRNELPFKPLEPPVYFFLRVASTGSRFGIV